jgi:hypothetical protein
VISRELPGVRKSVAVIAGRKNPLLDLAVFTAQDCTIFHAHNLCEFGERGASFSARNFGWNACRQHYTGVVNPSHGLCFLLDCLVRPGTSSVTSKAGYMVSPAWTGFKNRLDCSRKPTSDCSIR